jgi:KilA-N domain
MVKNKTIVVQATDIRLLEVDKEDFFSLTDIAKKFNEDNPTTLLMNWLRNKDTIELLGTWESLYNPNFNPLEFERIKNEAGSNRFAISASKWIESTNAIGIQSKSGRYGSGTFAHQDLALAFCYWLSPAFQLYVLKEFQRLKKEEAAKQKEQNEWDLKRTLSKVNYRIHTEAVREHLIPPRIVATKLEGIYFANEADRLNLALFGKTAKQWKAENPTLKGNQRDHASAEQLLVLANLENINAEYLRLGFAETDRIRLLNEVAIYQLQLILQMPALPQIGEDKE